MHVELEAYDEDDKVSASIRRERDAGWVMLSPRVLLHVAGHVRSRPNTVFSMGGNRWQSFVLQPNKSEKYVVCVTVCVSRCVRVCHGVCVCHGVGLGHHGRRRSCSP